MSDVKELKDEDLEKVSGGAYNKSTNQYTFYAGECYSLNLPVTIDRKTFNCVVKMKVLNDYIDVGPFTKIQVTSKTFDLLGIESEEDEEINACVINEYQFDGMNAW